MHLVSLVEQEVAVGRRCYRFRAGETIWTESSYKYGLEQFAQLARAAGFAMEDVWCDGGERFSAQLLRAG